MNNNELKGKMVMVPRTMYCREHVAYCMHVDKDYIYCIDWNGNRDRLSVSTQGFREATTQEIADAATHDCHLNAQDYDFC
jgi:hypothetical protein